MNRLHRQPFNSSVRRFFNTALPIAKPATDNQQPATLLKTAIVLAGGLGTRLRSVVQDIPKPMAPINGRPFVELVLDYLLKYEVERVIFSIGYRGKVVQEHFGKQYASLQIEYAVEEEPLGTGGGIFQAAQLCGDEPFFVVNGDTLFDADLFELEKFYHKNQADLAIALKKMSQFDRYGVIECADNQRITSFKEKAYREEGWINGGIYFFSKKVFEVAEFPERFSFEKDLLEKYLSELAFFGCPLEGYFIDIGIPEDYEKAEREL